MKKILGALVVGTLVFGAALVSASNLPLVNGTGVIQAADASGLACQSGNVAIGYTTQIQGDGLDHVTGVVLHGIESSCYGKWVDVSLMPQQTNPVPWIVSGWGTLPPSPDATIALQVSGPDDNPLASDVYRVSVAIRDN